MDINEIGLNITLPEVGNGSLVSFINSHGPGVYSYNSGTYGYSTYADSLATGLLIGGVNASTSGTVVINSNNTFSFSGTTTFGADSWDMNPQSRPTWANGVVWLANQHGGTNFMLYINGGRSTNFSGPKP